VMKFFSLQHFGGANLVSTLIANIVVNFMCCHHYAQHHPNNLKASHKRLYCARNQRPKENFELGLMSFLLGWMNVTTCISFHTTYYTTITW
jgi:hypothetical protein